MTVYNILLIFIDNIKKKNYFELARGKTYNICSIKHLKLLISSSLLLKHNILKYNVLP